MGEKKEGKKFFKWIKIKFEKWFEKCVTKKKMNWIEIKKIIIIIMKGMNEIQFEIIMIVNRRGKKNKKEKKEKEKEGRKKIKIKIKIYM